MGSITLILIFSLAFSLICKRLNIPVVIGQLFIGILLGPAGLKLVHHTEGLELIAEIGVILLMFLAGLESDLELLKKYLKPAISIAITGVITPLICFNFLGMWLNYSFTKAFFLGIVFAATSVSITVEVLNEYCALNSKEGATILGAAVFDDILAVLILSFFISNLGIQNSNTINVELPVKVILQILFVLTVYLLAKYLAPNILKIAKRLPVYASKTIVSIVLCLGLASLASLIGMSDVIGAFFAGIILSKSSISEEIEHDISKIGAVFFIPIFFASIGLNMSFIGISAQLPLLILFTAVAILSKLLPSIVIAKLFSFNFQQSYLIGAGMVSRGEMALIVLQIGLTHQLVSEYHYSLLVIVVILTTFLAPFLIRHGLAMNSEQ